MDKNHFLWGRPGFEGPEINDKIGVRDGHGKKEYRGMKREELHELIDALPEGRPWRQSAFGNFS